LRLVERSTVREFNQKEVECLPQMKNGARGEQERRRGPGIDCVLTGTAKGFGEDRA